MSLASLFATGRVKGAHLAGTATQLSPMQHDLIISFLSAPTEQTLKKFQRTPLHLQKSVPQKGARQAYASWLASKAVGGEIIPGLAREAGAKSEDEIGRVLVMGFSNGCVGVDELLRYDDSAKIDTVLAVDGIHGSFVGADRLYPGLYKRWLNHAAMCASINPELDPHSPIMAVTHSAIDPVAYPSTTMTAELIYHMVAEKAPPKALTMECGYGCQPVMQVASLVSRYSSPVEICSKQKCLVYEGIADGWYERRAVNGFYTFGWGKVQPDGRVTTRDPAGTIDHIQQGQYVLQALIDEMCARRWLGDCPPVAVAGLGQPDACTVPGGTVYSYSDRKKVDRFPELTESPPPGGARPVTTLPKCPPPPEGHVLVSSPDDPCATAPAKSASPKKAAEPPSLVAAGIGLATGYVASRWLASWWRRRP